MKSPYFFILLLFFTFCSTDNDPPFNEMEEVVTQPEEKVVDPTEEFSSSILTSSVEYINYTGSLLKSFASFTTDEELDYEFKDVNAFKLIYESLDENQQNVEVSGILILPDIEEPKGIISLQHSTLSSNDQAPSNSLLGANEFTVAAIYASTGYVTVISDYVGYGVNANQRHPYELRESLGLSSHDMIVAAKAYLEQNEIDVTDDLYLVGYSEGGFATLATHQKIEADQSFEITHTYSGAGAYDKTEFSKFILQKDEDLTFLGTYLWVLDVYNKHYSNLRYPWSYIVNEPYATNLENIGLINAPVADSLINLNPKELFTETFKNGLLEETDTHILMALMDNNLLDWTPVAPITLFHGTEDDYVYPLNSQNAFDQLSQNGGELEYIRIEGKNHQDAAIPFFFEALNRIHNKE